MYTKMLRQIVRIQRSICGHCDGNTGGGTGHCY